MKQRKGTREEEKGKRRRKRNKVEWGKKWCLSSFYLPNKERIVLVVTQTPRLLERPGHKGASV